MIKRSKARAILFMCLWPTNKDDKSVIGNTEKCYRDKGLEFYENRIGETYYVGEPTINKKF